MRDACILISGPTVSRDNQLAAELQQSGVVLRNDDNSRIQSILSSRPIDLMIIEIRGAVREEVAQLQLARERFPGMPVILVDGGGDREVIVAAFACGAKDAFKKPYKRYLLAERADALLRRRRGPAGDAPDNNRDCGPSGNGEPPTRGGSAMKRMLILFALFACAAVAAADTIHVPDDHGTIQGAIDAAMDRDTIIVAPGTYEENIDFLGKAIRLKSEEGPEDTIIDGGSPVDPDYGSVVLFISGEGPDTVLEGFTLTNGTGYNGTYGTVGGGICVAYESSPTIIHNIVTENVVYWNGGGIFLYDGSSPTIAYNTIENNETNGPGGSGGAGIMCSDNCSPLITNNTIRNNISTNDGAGIYCYDNCNPLISNNVISGNQATSDISWGGGLCCYTNSSPTITNNLIIGNQSEFVGGAMSLQNSETTLSSNTIAGNSAVSSGGACYFPGSTITITDSILWGNSAPEGPQIWANGNAEITARYSDVEGGSSDVYLGDLAVFNWGPGEMDLEPSFVSEGNRDYYLSNIACGDPSDSPCIDTGDYDSAMIWGTTRRDCCCDQSRIDMGYHYPGLQRLVFGPGPSPENAPLVRVDRPEQEAVHEFEFRPYGADGYGINVSCGDVDGDGYDEILTGAGPGAIYGPHVRGFEVADDGVMPLPGINFLAYGTLKYGVNVAAGDIDGDGYDEIITGAGPGAVYGPHVRGWNVDGGSVEPIPWLSFFAYGTLKYGVNVTCGDVDGDGIDEIVTGPGPGAVFGAHVRGWNVDGESPTPLSGFSFSAWQFPEYRCGANVFAGADLDGDGRDDLVVGAGPDSAVGTPVKVYFYDGTQINREDHWISLEAFPGLTHGATVAAGRF